jgi:hypothetical protein
MAALNNTLKGFIKLLLVSYQSLISPFLGANCRFYPNCSLYAQIAVERFGVVRGLWLAFKRLSRCHPWNSKCDWYDPVPDKNE